MADGGEPLDETVTEPPLAEESLRGLFQRLIANAKELGEAEIARLRAMVLRRAVESRYAVIIAVSSLLLAQAAVIVMLNGILIILTRAIGPGWATVIVTVGALAIAGIMARIALELLRRAIGKDD
jgi:hypothetical protein